MHALFKDLICCQAPTADLKALPSRILILPWGESKTNKGVVICNAATLSSLPGTQKHFKRERVALDFQHNTVEGCPFYKGEPAPIAAMGTLEVVAGEGIYLSALEWTPEGKTMAQGGHYPDISPAIGRNDKGEVIFIHSAGLVRQGEIDGLTLFSADSFLKLFNATLTKETSMDYKKILLAMLGLADTATDDEIKTATEALAAKKEPAPEIKAMAADIESLKTQLKERGAKDEKSERAALVAQASRDGKVIPLSAELIEQTPITVLSAMVKDLPVTVPLEKRTPGNVQEFSAGIGTSTNEQEVRKTLGISDEAWKKYNS